jgi:hypothetical protein
MKFNNNVILTVVILLSLFSLCKTTNAQGNFLEKESAKMQMADKNPASLSFNMKYTYEYYDESSVVIDSSMGSLKMSGAYYWGSIDSTEYMQNNSYNVVLHKEEKIMQVGNVQEVYQKIMNIATFDSLIGKNNYTVQTGTEGVLKFIRLNFTDPNFNYNEFGVYYDSTSYLVHKMKYIIKDEDAPANLLPANKIMTVIGYFTNYQTLPFSNTVFSTANYFQVVGNQYQPQPPFDSYKVYITSPNLILQ